MKAENILKSLSRRERAVVGWLLEGLSNKQIALALGISERTVEFHLKNVYGKLQVASRVELILKSGKAMDSVFENPVESTVVIESEQVHNGSQPAQRRWAKSLRGTVSLIKQEIAMTLRISFEDLENYLRSHPSLFSLLTFLIVSLTTHYVVYGLGLYFWVSYVLLGLALSAGSIALGLSLKKMMNSAFQGRPLVIIISAVLLPLIAAGFDQVYLNTVLRFTGPISTTIANISATAEWLISPEGTPYRSTHLSVTSDVFWFFALACMLILFFFSRVAGKGPDKNNLVSA